MSNEMNFNEILNKFNGFHNDINVTKLETVNKMK